MKDTIAARVKKANEIVRSAAFQQKQAEKERIAVGRMVRQIEADKEYQKRMLNGRKVKAKKSSAWLEEEGEGAK